MNETAAEWHTEITDQAHLPFDVTRQLRESGFVILPGPTEPVDHQQLSDAYDQAVALADPEDVHVSRSGCQSRIDDVINWGSGVRRDLHV
jgi:hypothetical protein